MDFETAAVIGLGTMGAGIALLLAGHGIDVVVADVSPERARSLVSTALKRRGRSVGPRSDFPDVGLDPMSSEVLRRRRDGPFLKVADSAESAACEVDLVIEAIPEDLDAKMALLEQISRCAPRAVIASNTSSLSIDSLASAVQAPARFLGVHFFNPAELVPGVEVIRSDVTDALVVTQVVELLTALGKVPAVVRSSPGFVANRLQLALFLEALRCVEEGLATAEAVDAIVRSTFGFRLPAYGPLAIADHAGLDVYKSILEELQRGFGERFAVPDRLRVLVESGRLGVKSGAGIFEHPDALDESLAARDRVYRAIAHAVGSDPAVGDDERGANRGANRGVDRGADLS